MLRWRFGRAVSMAYGLRLLRKTRRWKDLDKLGLHRTCHSWDLADLAHGGSLFALTRSREFEYTREIFGPKKGRLLPHPVPASSNLPKIWQDFFALKILNELVMYAGTEMAPRCGTCHA